MTLYNFKFYLIYFTAHRGRGSITGAGTERIIRAANSNNNNKKQLAVQYREDGLRALGENVSRFISEVCTTVRHCAPHNYTGWKQIRKTKREEFIRNLCVSNLIIII